MLFASHTQHLGQGAIVSLINVTVLNAALPFLLPYISRWADWAADYKHGSGQDQLNALRQDHHRCRVVRWGRCKLAGVDQQVRRGPKCNISGKDSLALDSTYLTV